ncbi:MAG: uracil-DNA glycosylase [Steroidobacteraceae bacterium]
MAASPPERTASEVLQFDPGCRACPRLAAHLERVRAECPDYHARPVAPFGCAAPAILIVGLAPGMHGANRTGRPFTGDFAGRLLYATLHTHALATRADSVSVGDSLQLRHARITNAVKCLPPANKPQTAEIRRCNGYLRAELAHLRSVRVILALGHIAHDAVALALDVRRASIPFGHGRMHTLPGNRTLLDSYHCSRYNTQTRRLTADMFSAVVARAVELAGLPRARQTGARPRP